MKKLTTLILLLLSPLVIAQDEDVEDIYLKCVSSSEELVAVSVSKSTILWISSDDTWSETALFKESALGYVQMPLVSIEKIESGFGGDSLGDEELSQLLEVAERELQRRHKVNRQLRSINLKFGDDPGWVIDRLSGIATHLDSGAEEVCTSITREELVQLLSEYNQKLQSAKNRVIESRKF